MLSTRELAMALGVSESSLKRWIDAGKITATRTEGGHRRVLLSDAIRFVRETRAPIARPELLDLPKVAAARARGDDRLASFVRQGDGGGASGWLAARYLAGVTVAELADGPIRDAMNALGELWHTEDTGVFVEHRGTDACLQAVAHLRGMMETVPENARVALGGGPAGDPYILATQLAAMVCTEAGMRAVNLGPDTPVDAFERAAAEHRPALVWISISSPLPPARARSMSRWLETLPTSTAIVIGGAQARTLSSVPAHALRATSMADLAEVAAAAVASRR
jgi:excisionase family DNA binding protein